MAAGSVAPSRRTPAGEAERFREIVRNGYTYRIDPRGRTRRVSGALTLARAPRSRSAQLRAGGPDRRPGDDGGHYVAVRFNGPTDAFNHFAQDAGFNRGNYRALEDQWARAKRAGHVVTIRIVPEFDGVTARPSSINVWFDVDGHPESLNFPNGSKGKRRERR